MFQTNVVSYNRGVTGCDVAEGASVNQGRGVLKGLEQVGVDGVLKQDCHCAVCAKVLSGYGVAVHVVADDDACQAVAQVFEAGGQ